MCLMIYKPYGARIAHDLLAAAFIHNMDGAGLMGFEDGGSLLIERSARVSLRELQELEARHAEHEYVLHLRRRTRGSAGAGNVHPFKVADGLYLMHNGTIPLASRVADRSDSWHFVADILRPLAQRHPGLLLDGAFHRVIEFGLKPENKFALLDAPGRRIVLINREHGGELDGLWLSNTRWIDRKRFPLARTRQPQARALDIRTLDFV